VRWSKPPAMPLQHATDAHRHELGPPPLRLAAPPRRRPAWRALVGACRPRQWLKNALVVIAPAAAGTLSRPSEVAAVLGALVVFCLLASATYLVNDVRDRDRDRRHPRKRLRPVAAGELSPAAALRAAAAAAGLGLAMATLVRPGLALVALGYLALTTSYSLWWRHLVIADMVAIAGGFVLRAAAGGVAARVSLSASFLAVTSACALFVVAGKRYAELVAGREAAATRATLRRYSRGLLRAVLAGAALVASVAYLRWAFTRAGVWIELSALPFVFWLGRYAAMVAAGHGEAPEELILRDPGLLWVGGAWALMLAAGIYVAS